MTIFEGKMNLFDRRKVVILDDFGLTTLSALFPLLNGRFLVTPEFFFEIPSECGDL